MSSFAESRLYSGENIWKVVKGIGEGERRKEGNEERAESNGEHRNRKIEIRDRCAYDFLVDCCCLSSLQFYPYVLTHYFHTCQK
jgi:hypothetical protein